MLCRWKWKVILLYVASMKLKYELNHDGPNLGNILQVNLEGMGLEWTPKGHDHYEWEEGGQDQYQR
jgi:hypothetical protein